MINVICIDSPDSTIFAFHGELTVENGHALKAFLMEPAPRDRVSLDFAAVTAVDAAGLQLLCAAHRQWRRMGKHVAALETNVPPVLRKATNDAGYVRNEGCFPDARTECLWVERGGNE